MKRFAPILTAISLAGASPASAHPAPFSYVDIHITANRIDVIVVAHIFDVSHDLHVEPQERLLDSTFLAQQSDAIVRLLSPRFHMFADGAELTARSWTPATSLPDRQAIGLGTSFDLSKAAGVITLDALLFPYDPAHQTFVNVYEGDTLTLQAILDATKTRLDYYPGSRQGTWAVARRFAPVGARHILLGADHLVFLFGLVLLGGSVRRLALIALAFVLGNTVAFALTALNLMHPPARMIEPALALSIVYIGADNLMVRGGRDMRPAIAFAFGLIHGFWFANGLRAMDLPARTLDWSLLSFDVGLDLAQLLVLAVLGSAALALRAKRPALAGRLATAGSIVVIIAGVYWFVQRVFFPGGFV